MSSGSEQDSSSYSSGSESESSSGSENELGVLQRPVFVRKTKKASQGSDSATSVKTDTVLAKAEFQQNLESKEVKTLDFDGVDDTDDIDPQAEFEAWKERERLRKERDMRRAEEKRNEKDGIYLDEASIGSKGGVFYRDVDENLLKRESAEVEDSGDHSRPTRFKPGKV
ncbi:hypothetical protein ACI3LY_003003 [Candidozyma auris]|uniref:Micro-fibrillar-associated protein 1 C-terminal domain-containing protein n=1 Tax=Candidozyma auris TaxID=498019 RepID=A0A2H0ZN65_CANAR|nr:hypothetical protein QG37_04936 [[Candida] auris]PIS52090.1 hypothetical protein B9J08_003701 [[Candida] auris]PIS54078.1 hypothetical protein CJI97_003776 [[Candida] auris]